MKPLLYYQTMSVFFPKKDDYITIYYYRGGKIVGVKKQFDTNFEPPKNCVEEKVFDEVSYTAHMKLYIEESKKLQDEFKRDLINKYKMTNHPKAEKIFNKAWDFGYSSGYEDIEYYFQDLIELFECNCKLPVCFSFAK
jgi:hypothetical protein